MEHPVESLRQSSANIGLGSHRGKADLFTERKLKGTPAMEEKVFSCFVGIDWGEKKHQVRVLDGAGRELGSRSFSHKGKGLKALVKWLLEKAEAGPESVAVAIERPDGPVVATLLAAGFAVHVINPRQSSNLRKFVSHAGHKDDHRDAGMLAGAALTHRQVMRRLRPHPELIERLRERTKTADRLLREQLRQCQRIRNTLVDFFPQMLEVASKLKHLGQPLFFEIWEKAPTPAAARKVRRSTWASLLQRYGVKRISAERVFELFREEPLTVAPGATAAAVETIRTALTLLRVVNAEVARAEEQMTQLLDALSETEEIGGGPAAPGPDLVTILRSRKGLGDKSLARLFAWAFEAVCGGDYRRLRAASGVAPVGEQSGTVTRARIRRSVPYSLQQAAYILARGVLRWDEGAKAYNRKLKEAGKTTARRQRGIADKEFRVLCAMVRTRTLFDPHFRGRSGRDAA